MGMYGPGEVIVDFGLDFEICTESHMMYDFMIA